MWSLKWKLFNFFFIFTQNKRIYYKSILYHKNQSYFLTLHFIWWEYVQLLRKQITHASTLVAIRQYAQSRIHLTIKDYKNSTYIWMSKRSSFKNHYWPWYVVLSLGPWSVSRVWYEVLSLRPCNESRIQWPRLSHFGPRKYFTSLTRFHLKPSSHTTFLMRWYSEKVKNSFFRSTLVRARYVGWKRNANVEEFINELRR